MEDTDAIFVDSDRVQPKSNVAGVTECAANLDASPTAANLHAAGGLAVCPPTRGRFLRSERVRRTEEGTGQGGRRDAGGPFRGTKAQTRISTRPGQFRGRTSLSACSRSPSVTSTRSGWRCLTRRAARQRWTWLFSTLSPRGTRRRWPRKLRNLSKRSTFMAFLRGSVFFMACSERNERWGARRRVVGQLFRAARGHGSRKPR